MKNEERKCYGGSYRKKSHFLERNRKKNLANTSGSQTNWNDIRLSRHNYIMDF
jgi:hypothetical protein